VLLQAVAAVTDRHDVAAVMRTAQKGGVVLVEMMDDRKTAPAAACAAAICAELRLQTTLLAHIHGYALSEGDISRG
jgi:hypothetical protein